MALISKQSFPYIIIHLLFTEIRGHYLFPLWSRQIHFDDGGITYFTLDHDSGISLATKSHILQPREYLPHSSSGVFEEEKKYHSAQYFYRLNQIFYRSINFSNISYGDDLTYSFLLPKRTSTTVEVFLHYCFFKKTRR